MGLRGHYHLMDLDLLGGRALPDLLGAVRLSGFRGVNITYPCKEAVLPLLDAASTEARRIGAVNTVTFGRDGETTGHNTDCIGFRRGFEEAFGREAATDASVLMIGAGGAGRAVAFALFDLGVREVIIADQSQRQAESLVAALRTHFGEACCRLTTKPELALASVAGVVNATPVGMIGVPGLPIPIESITARHWVADVIYSPLETAFLKAARAKGARVMGGAGMCIHQAAEAFRLFTGSGADVERMRRTFETVAARRTIDRAS
jgi:shikimate dehydrogenase